MRHLTTLFIIVFAVAPILCSTSSAELTKVPIEEAQAREVRLSPGAEIDITNGVPLDEICLEQIGTTWYDYQTNGSTGNRVEKSADGAIHVSWMNQISEGGDRHVYWDYLSGGQWHGGVQVNDAIGAGYTTIDKTQDGRSVVAYHQFTIDRGVFVGVDATGGFGLFAIHPVPNTFPGENGLFWPYLAVDNNENFHIVITEEAPSAADPQFLGYTFSSDGGATWTTVQGVDIVMDISAITVASEVDDKVAIVYTKPLREPDSNQYNNDVVYIESEDGVTWDFNNKINITNYQWEDTMRAYTDVDAIYDNNGDLHIIWNAPGYFADEGGIYTDACFLYHWSEATGINLIYDAWHLSFPGAWNRSASKMSIGADNTNALYCIWTHFDAIDISAGGFSNGEIYVSISYDGGINWTDPLNITNSQSLNCQPGDCESDHWSSMAETVDNRQELYIMYINDRDAGGIPQNEGTATENPVMYIPWSPPTSVGENSTTPASFDLIGNYPNPFNASTNIEFRLVKAADVELGIYNIAGEKITELVNNHLNAGVHTINWDALDMASGVYFYKLRVNDESLTKRMVIIK